PLSVQETTPGWFCLTGNNGPAPFSMRFLKALAKRSPNFKLRFAPSVAKLKFSPWLTKPTVTTGLVIATETGPDTAIKARIELGAAADGGGSARRLVIRKVRVPAPGGTNGNPGKITSFTKPVLNPVNTFPDGIIGGVPFTWPTNGIPLLMF